MGALGTEGSQRAQGGYALIAVLEERSDEPASDSCGRGQRSSHVVGTTTSLVENTCVARIIQLQNALTWKLMDFLFLFIALAGNSFCLLMDFPDDPSVLIMDIVMVVASTFFVIDLIFKSITVRTYPWSFFFWADALGTLSMVYEMSFLFGPAGKHGTHYSRGGAVLARAARAARMGARAGRLSRVNKCFAMLTQSGAVQAAAEQPTSRILGSRLTQVLSSKIATLAIVLALGLPLFSIGRFPEDDYSLSTWSHKLEKDYERDVDAKKHGRHEQNLRRSLEDMVAFYHELPYYPFLVEGFGEDGRSVEHLMRHDRGSEPKRAQNILAQTVHSHEGEAVTGHIYFDMTFYGKYGAMMDLASLVFIVLCMCVESFDLARSVDLLVNEPLDKMMVTARGISKTMHSVMPEQAFLDEDEVEGQDEAEFLQGMFERLGRWLTVMTTKNRINKDDMADLDDESRGIMQDLLNVHVRNDLSARTTRRLSAATIKAMDAGATKTQELSAVLTEQLAALDTWHLSTLALEKNDLMRMVRYIIFDSPVGAVTGRLYTQKHKFENLLVQLEAGYNTKDIVPYHNFCHAVDVLASCYRIMETLSWAAWMTDVEAFALQVASLAHDIGHPGRTNPFLIETSNELALRYNDKSPLENFHCAYLFELCRKTDSDIWEQLEPQDKQTARRICIGTILSTDNAHHFDMVKSLQAVFEMKSELCKEQLLLGTDLKDEYTELVLQEHAEELANFILHMADVSNPFKSFATSKAWATLVLNEFFLQGDEEKKLGMPVGMLNDREKVNVPGSQHGFVNFLVAPLVVAAVQLLPMMHPLADRMTQSMSDWKDVFVKESSPSPEEVKKREDDLEKIKTQLSTIRRLSCKAAPSGR
eukprot:TRINITY_DN22823_c0_g1_i1.p1 TRINITY_DN22823_c0_g1~~TRINITY_DN22823_c0_g1_i1.p1  ORF type:complete len:872 (-),score=174.07 TRINITY_DN22823_c0_g1_i1:101-2716(-)